MRRLAILTCGLLAAWAVAADVELTPDTPPVAPAKPGTASGTIAPADRVGTLRAVSRVTGKQYTPTTWDAKTGAFAFRDLPGAAAYDLEVTTPDGRRIEGVDLSYVDSEFEPLVAARAKELDLPVAREPKPFTKDDVSAIEAFVRDWVDFLDQRRVLCISGEGDRATLLVELMRTTAFHASGTDEDHEVVWRVELWYLVRAGGGWERVPNVERMLQRFRGKPDEWRKIDVTYLPSMSIPIDRDGRSEPVEITLPDKPMPSAGRPANTRYDLPSRPTVLGLPPSDAPASAPASAN